MKPELSLVKTLKNAHHTERSSSKDGDSLHNLHIVAIFP